MIQSRHCRAVALALALAAVLAVSPSGTRAAAPARAAQRAPAVPRPPDILLITVDALRADRLPWQGYGLQTAPFLDSLARDAVVFTQARSVSSWTVPSLATLCTGLYPQSHGVSHGSVIDRTVMNQEILPRSQPTLAEVLSRRGYRTLAVVANSHAWPGGGFDRGFDSYDCVGFVNGTVVLDSLRALRPLIEERTKPLFLWVHFFDPHHPYRPRQPWLKNLHPEVTSGDLQFAETVMNRWNNLPDAAAPHMDRLMSTAGALYDSEIREVDEQIRILWREMPRLANCVLVFTADHGEELREHGQMTHGFNLYDSTVRIPLFMRAPGGGAPDTVRSVVSLIDVAPTLLAAAGARIPSNWAGEVLIRDGRATPPPAGRSVLAELERIPKQALLKAWIGPRWKLIQDINSRITELYDLSSDPGERHNVAAAAPESAAATLAGLKRRIASLPVAPPPSAVTLRTMSPALIEMLKGLGYLN